MKNIAPPTSKQPTGATKFWLYAQALFLTIGSGVGWYSVINEVQDFCAQQGEGLSSLLSFTGTYTTNPLLQPCFWGSIAFVAGLVWTLAMLAGKVTNISVGLRRTRLFFVGATLFAAANNYLPIYRFVTDSAGDSGFGCSAAGHGNPFLSACFFGLLSFALALLANTVAIHYRQQLAKQSSTGS